MVGRKITPITRSARTAVVTLNARPRTRTRYSRRATWRAFGKSPLIRRDLLPVVARCSSASSTAPADVLDEDLLEARLGDLEERDPIAPIHGGTEDRRGVAVGGHVEPDVVLAPGRDGHPGDVAQPLGAVAIAVDREAHHPPAHRASRLGHRAADDDPAAVDDRDRLAQLLDRLHLVRAEDQGLAAPRISTKASFSRRTLTGSSR